MVVCKFFQQGYCRFGQSCRFEHVYGSKYTYRAPQTQNQNTNVGNQGGFGSNASSLFRSAVQNTSTFNSNNSVFGQNPVRVSVFDRLGDQNPNSYQNNQAKSIFAQANQSVFQQPQPTNVFQTQNQARSIFSQATQSAFGSQASFASQQNASNLFASAAQRLSHNEPDSQMTNASSASNNIFQISDRPATNVFGVANVLNQSSNNEEESLYYSKVEDLSADEIEAFNCAEFKLGFIPELPPPKSLCT